ncbi:MAG: hypothetical protein WC765_02225, partial [Phycisphaerae bacterium]
MANVIEKKNRRILVIDDKEAIHEDFRQILSRGITNAPLDAARNAVFGADTKTAAESFEVDCAFDGRDGLLKVIESQKSSTPYATAFVDLRMESDWDGIETIEQLWRVQPDLQMVLCTAYSDYSWTEIIDRLGPTERLLILKKPFD